MRRVARWTAILTLAGLAVAFGERIWIAVDKRWNGIHAHVLARPFILPPGVQPLIPDVKGLVTVSIRNFENSEVQSLKVKVPSAQIASIGQLNNGWIPLPPLMSRDTTELVVWTSDVPDVDALNRDMVVAYDNRLGAVWVYYPDAGKAWAYEWQAWVVGIASLLMLFNSIHFDRRRRQFVSDWVTKEKERDTLMKKWAP